MKHPTARHAASGPLTGKKLYFEMRAKLAWRTGEHLPPVPARHRRADQAYLSLGRVDYGFPTTDPSDIDLDTPIDYELTEQVA
jgi:hypothetical protein